MKCRAALWFAHPGNVVPQITTYPSMQAVHDDFEDMAASYRQLGGAKPAGTIYAYDSDEPLYHLDVTDHGRPTRKSA